MPRLILSRKPGQSILIGENIRVMITGYRDGAGAVTRPIGISVSIGIEAPVEVPIMREELVVPYEKKPLIGGIEKK